MLDGEDHLLTRFLGSPRLPAFARGCAILGAGGGGDTELGLVMAARAVAEHGEVALVDAEELPPDALIMPCGQAGEPNLATERIWSGDEGRVLRDAMEDVHGAPVAALMCVEIGGANGLLPVTWAARLGLPLLDADGRGRALPTVHANAMQLAGVPVSPAVATDGRGNVLVLQGADDAWADRLAWGAAASLGGICAVAHSCLTADRARDGVVRGSISQAIALGMASGRRGIDAREAEVLMTGRVVDLERRSGNGSGRRSATVRGGTGRAARELRLELEDVYLLALEDGAVRAAVPDVICVLAGETGAPVSVELLRQGQRVTVVALPGPDVWRSAAGLALAGPAAFGYDLDDAPRADGTLDAGL
jgi:DUF917 family protein